VPEIDYIWRGERYCDLIGREFDVVYSSHNIEHQPDLIAHLQDVASVLRSGGTFCLVIPDKRYCFDHFIPGSIISAVIEAHVYRRRRHSLATLITDKMMHTHNDALEHWRGNHGHDPRFIGPSEYRTQLLQELVSQGLATDAYIDAHAWQFTPDGFRSITGELNALGMTSLMSVRVYHTVYGSFEFYAVLVKQ
jgi:SAM-dependent methyltransferase